MTRLEYRDRPYGPTFPTQADAEAFRAWVEARTGLGFEHQSEAVLARLREAWASERAHGERR